jgi:aminomethyltransferase
MANISSLRTTPLHDWHLQHNANMAEFGGYHMPLWYTSGAKKEHLAVIKQAGMFDTSHMAVITVEGEGSFSLLQSCFTKDISRCIGRNHQPLSEGRSVYGLFLQQDGSVLDDAIVSLLSPKRYMIVVNSGMGSMVAEHLRSHCVDNTEIIDFTDQLGKIDIQGPSAGYIIGSLFDNPDEVLHDMAYFSFKGDISQNSQSTLCTKGGIELLLSRTGYTGEFGFELFVRAADTMHMWQALLDAGKKHGVVTCGLASRDSLRAGAMLPLSHQDIGNWLFANTPWSFVLPWAETSNGFTKQFIGAEAVMAGSDASFTYGFAGYDPRKLPAGDTTIVMDSNNRQLGRLLTCTTDMAIGRSNGHIFSVASPVSAGRPADFIARGLCCGFIIADRPCKRGEKVLLSDGKRRLAVEIRDEVRPDRTARRPIGQMIITD